MLGMAKYCSNCGTKVSFFRLLSFDLDGDVFLPCKECGTELVNPSRAFLFVVFHVILVVIGGLIGRQFELGWEALLLALGVQALLFFLLFPFSKDGEH